MAAQLWLQEWRVLPAHEEPGDAWDITDPGTSLGVWEVRAGNSQPPKPLQVVHRNTSERKEVLKNKL